MPAYAPQSFPAANPTVGPGTQVQNYNPPQSLSEGSIGYAFGTYDWLAQVAVGEAVALGASQAFAIQSRKPVGGNSGRTVTFDYEFGVAPDAITVELQGAMQNVDADYVKIADSTTFTTAPNSTTVENVRFNFLRLKVTALTLGAGAGIVARILA